MANPILLKHRLLVSKRRASDKNREDEKAAEEQRWKELAEAIEFWNKCVSGMVSHG